MKPFIQNQDLLDMIGDFSGCIWLHGGKRFCQVDIVLRFYLKPTGVLERYIKLKKKYRSNNEIFTMRQYEPKTLTRYLWRPIYAKTSVLQTKLHVHLEDRRQTEISTPDLLHRHENYKKIEELLLEIERDRIQQPLDYIFWEIDFNQQG